MPKHHQLAAKAPASNDLVLGIYSHAAIYPPTDHRAHIWMTVAAMVASGREIGLVPQSLARTNIGDFRFLSLGGPQAMASTMLAWNPHLMPLAFEKFFASAAATIREQAGASVGAPSG